MATDTENVRSVFEQALDSLRKASEAGIEMQQELLRQWGANWPGFPQPQNVWLERVQKFQKDWSKTVTELMNKNRKTLDDQYRLAIDSLKEAFHVAEASDPQQYRQRCEELCRKSLDYMREAAELQVKETQDALSKWISLAAKSGS